MFRSHGTDVRREPWHFGEEGVPFYDAVKEAIDLRYRLMPYIYSAAADASLKDGTMMRMLAFEYRKDETALVIKDQYLFGKSIMVCPVTHPMYYESGSGKSKILSPQGGYTCPGEMTGTIFIRWTALTAMGMATKRESLISPV